MTRGENMHGCEKNIETCVCFSDSLSKANDWFYVDKNGVIKCEISKYNHEKLRGEIASILFEAYKKTL